MSSHRRRQPRAIAIAIAITLAGCGRADTNGYPVTAESVPTTGVDTAIATETEECPPNDTTLATWCWEIPGTVDGLAYIGYNAQPGGGSPLPNRVVWQVRCPTCDATIEDFEATFEEDDECPPSVLGLVVPEAPAGPADTSVYSAFPCTDELILEDATLVTTLHFEGGASTCVTWGADADAIAAAEGCAVGSFPLPAP